MAKEDIISVFTKGYKEFIWLPKKLSPKQIETIPVVGKWTVKDVIAHLAAWNWEQAKEIKRVLKGEPTWNNPEYDAYNDDKFNKIQVGKRKNTTLKVLIKELESSFNHLIETISALSNKEWNHKCEDQFWEDGKDMTIQSLFLYESEGYSDTSRHAKEIREHFNL